MHFECPQERCETIEGHNRIAVLQEDASEPSFLNDANHNQIELIGSPPPTSAHSPVQFAIQSRLQGGGFFEFSSYQIRYQYSDFRCLPVVCEDIIQAIKQRGSKIIVQKFGFIVLFWLVLLQRTLCYSGSTSSFYVIIHPLKIIYDYG